MLPSMCSNEYKGIRRAHVMVRSSPLPRVSNKLTRNPWTSFSLQISFDLSSLNHIDYKRHMSSLRCSNFIRPQWHSLVSIETHEWQHEVTKRDPHLIFKSCKPLMNFTLWMYVSSILQAEFGVVHSVCTVEASKYWHDQANCSGCLLIS